MPLYSVVGQVTLESMRPVEIEADTKWEAEDMYVDIVRTSGEVYKTDLDARLTPTPAPAGPVQQRREG